MQLAPFNLPFFILSLGVTIMAAVALYKLRCSWSSVTVIKVDKSDVGNGVHFYEPRPYLLVTKTEGVDAGGKNSSGFVYQIVWLPNYERRFRVEVKPGWGTVSGSVKLQNGWMLESLGAEMDSKSPESISAVGGLVTAALTALKTTPPPTQGREEPYAVLYLIHINDGGEVSFERSGGLAG